MQAFAIEEKLTSTPGQKATSGGLAIVIAAILISILMFFKIVVPNPPFEKKAGEVEVDLGITDAGFGAPDQGGPSPTPPALGGGESDGGAPAPAGGEGKVVATSDPSTVNLPPIDPPASTAPNEDPALKNRLGKVGSRKGKGTGNPNGSPDGSGTTGWGPGKGNTGITGNHGKKLGGTGLYGYDFTNYRLNSSLRRINADGQGTIACRVSVDCGGNWSVVDYGTRGTTYTGSVDGLKQVVTTFLRSATFEKIGDQCPESGIVYIEVKSKI